MKVRRLIDNCWELQRNCAKSAAEHAIVPTDALYSAQECRWRHSSPTVYYARGISKGKKIFLFSKRTTCSVGQPWNDNNKAITMKNLAAQFWKEPRTTEVNWRNDCWYETNPSITPNILQRCKTPPCHYSPLLSPLPLVERRQHAKTTTP